MRGLSLFDDEAESGVLTPKANRPEPAPELLYNGTRVRSLFQNVAGRGALAPSLTIEVLQDKAWRRFADEKTNIEYSYERFDDFVKAKPPAGLGREGGVPELRAIIEPYATRVIKDDRVREQAIKALRMIDRETPPEGKHGTNQHSEGRDNVTSLPERGNTEAYALRRLKRDRPDLAEKVINREISANAAAKEAGFRKPMIQIQPTVDGFRRAAERHLSAEQRLQLKEAL